MDPSKIEKFENWLKVRYNPATVYQYIKTFNRYPLETQEDLDFFIYNYTDKETGLMNAYYKGFLKANIECFGKNLIVPKSKRKGSKLVKDYVFLNKDSIDYLISFTSPYVSFLIRLYFETGLRLNELFKVKKENIDLENRCLKGIGKGNKPFKVRFSEGSKIRIKELLDIKQDDYPFQIPKVKYSYRWFQYHLQKEAAELGFVLKVTPHKLRHALGHYMIEKGFTLPDVQSKLRHSDISTTQIYVKSNQEMVDDKLDKTLSEE